MRGTQVKLGAAVKEARKQRKLTQIELAGELGVSVRYLQTIENERQAPSYKMLERILEYLEIPANIIFDTGHGNITPEKEKLFYLINNKCNSDDVEILLSTAEVLVSKRSI